MIRLGLAGAGVALLAAGAAAWIARGGGGGDAPPVIPGDAGERILVEVLNGTQVDGLARETTRRLRAQGIDVVFFGSVRDSVWQTTEVIARRGDTVMAARVRDALAAGAVVLRPAPELLLDVTVILGMDAAPPGRLRP